MLCHVPLCGKEAGKREWKHDGVDMSAVEINGPYGRFEVETAGIWPEWGDCIRYRGNGTEFYFYVNTLIENESYHLEVCDATKHRFRGDIDDLGPDIGRIMSDIEYFLSNRDLSLPYLVIEGKDKPNRVAFTWRVKH